MHSLAFLLLAWAPLLGLPGPTATPGLPAVAFVDAEIQDPADPQDPDPPQPDNVESWIANAIPSQSEEDEGPGAAEIYREASSALKTRDDAEKRQREFEALLEGVPAEVAKIETEIAEGWEAFELPKGLTPIEVETKSLDAEARVERRKEALAKLEREKADRESARAEIPVKIADLRAELTVLREGLSDEPAPGFGETGHAELMLQAAKIAARKAEIGELQAQLRSFDARKQLLVKRTELATRYLERVQAEKAAWQDALRAQKGKETQNRIEQVRELESTHVLLRPIYEECLALAKRAGGDDGLDRREAETADRIEELEAKEQEVRAAFTETFKRVRRVGTAGAMGRILWSEYKRLDDPRALKDEVKLLRRRISEKALQRILDQDRLNDIEVTSQQLGELQSEFNALPEGERGLDEQEFLEEARKLLEFRVRMLDEYIPRYEAYGRDLDRRERLTSTYLVIVTDYRDYLQERILWVPSVDAVQDAGPFFDGVLALIDPGAWLQALNLIQGEFFDNPGKPLGLGLLIILLGATRPWAKRTLQALAERVARFRTDAFPFTIYALLLTVIPALWIALGIWSVGWLLTWPTSMVQEAGVAFHTGKGLQAMGMTLFILEFFKALLAPKGVAEAHFRWPVPCLQAIRKEVGWFLPLVLPILGVISALKSWDFDPWTNSLGRVAFAIGMGALAIFSHRLFRRRETFLDDYFRREPGGVLERSYPFWSRLTVWVPVGLVVLALVGYYYTALQLEQRMVRTMGLTLALILAYGLLLRWLHIVRRKIAVDRAQARAEARRLEAAEGKSDEDDAVRESAGAPVDEESLDLPAVNAQTRQLFRSLITVVAAIGLYLIWIDVLPALKFFDRFQLWPSLEVVEVDKGEPPVYLDLSGSEGPTAPEDRAKDPVQGPGETASGEDGVSSEVGSLGALATALPGSSVPGTSEGEAESGEAGVSGEAKGVDLIAEIVGVSGTRITVADVGLALILLALTLMIARNFPALIELGVLRHLPLDSGARFAITTLSRYFILLLGIPIALGAIHIGWAQVQWLAAALTFGLAFGLQEIFANFISGIIILLERPVRPGDIVTVDGVDGRIMRIRMRATVMIDWDRKEYLIPNKNFITGNVINWTLADPVTRMIIPVGIAYGSDTRLARKLMLEAAKSVKHILEDPGPNVIFVGFGDSSLDFQIRIFVNDRDLWPVVMNEIHLAVDEAFRDNDIEIPFPQRDLHLRSDATGRLDDSAGSGPVDDGRPSPAT